MMAVMVVPFGRLNSASTTACLDLPVLEWTTRFGFFALDRLFAPDRGFALARPLLLVMSVPLNGSRRTIAPHHHNPAEADRRWRGRGALSLDLEPISIGPPLATTERRTIGHG